MASPPKNILITGLPGSGKTTLIQKLAVELREYGPIGFFTGEILEHGIRKGFKLTSFDQKKTGVLAHVDIKGLHRVGKYGVDLEAFEHFLGTLPVFDLLPRIVIIDEIGRMECLSARFQHLVASLLDAPSPFIATIALKADGFIDEVKHRPDMLLYEITRRNRDALLPVIAGLIRSLPCDAP
jgi:nucleoside-triphosphatase